MSAEHPNDAGNALAIIGMAGRWPRAQNVAEFWRNVRDGIDCISQFSAEELEVQDAAARAQEADYVKARSVVEGVDQFDAGFFGILPKEAELMDPQQRVFLECCWEALEDAGYDPRTYAGAIGVYAGCSTNSYFLRNLCVDRTFIQDYVGAYPLGHYPTMLGALADSLSTRVSYKLGLRGPSCTIQSACSTSLVAVCQACQSLLTYQSDMALAGGVSITFPQKRGYRHQEGGMGSHRAQRGRAGQSGRHGPRPRRCRSRVDHLPRSARHGDAAWRPDRIHRVDAGIPSTDAGQGFLRTRLGQGEHRPPGSGCGRDRPHQRRFRIDARATAAGGRVFCAQPEHRFRQQSLLRQYPPRRLAARA
jgi:hypothetical protein